MTIAPLAPFRTEPAPQSDDHAFAELYRQYQPQLIRYVTHHFGSRDADEITQEALTRALRSLERDRSGAETWAWLVRVARNVAHDIARSRRICEATDDDELLVTDFADDALLPEPAALLDERREQVRQALSTLPATQRRILVLYEVDELNCPAIARLVGSNESAVRKALQRARSRFAAEFRALGGASFGSVVFWLRALRRRTVKALPAASASTAAIVAVGTMAVTISVGPPQVEFAPDRGAPLLVANAPEAAVRRAPAAARPKAVTAASRSRRTAPVVVAGPGPSVTDPTSGPAARVTLPFGGGSGKTSRYLGADLPTGHQLRTGVEVDPEDDHGPLCDLDLVTCESPPS